MKSFFEWIAAQIKWLKSFFEEADGSKASSKRLIGGVTVGAFLFSYVKVALATSTIQDIPVNWMFMICGVIGLNVFDAYLKLKNGNKEPGIKQ